MQVLSSPPIAAAMLPALIFAALAGTAKGDVRFDWEPTPEAAYYQGVLGSGDSAIDFRTSGTWLMLDPATAIRVRAFGPHGQDLGPVQVRQAAPSPSPATPAGGARQTQAKDDVNLEEEAAAPTPARRQVEEPDDTPKPTPSLTDVSLSLGIGRERLQASGGASSYSGSANIGGINLHGSYQPQGSGWTFDGLIEAHDYETVTTVQPPGGGAAQQVDSKLLRLRLAAGAFYDVAAVPTGGPGPLRVAFGAGLVQIRLPLLEVTDPTTGGATLTTVSATRPFVGAIFGYQATPKSTFTVNLADVPAAFETAPALTSLELGVDWRYDLTSKLYVDLGAAYARDAASVSVTCPAVDNCQTGSSATAAMTQGRMGLGARW